MSYFQHCCYCAKNQFPGFVYLRTVRTHKSNFYRKVSVPACGTRICSHFIQTRLTETRRRFPGHPVSEPILSMKFWKIMFLSRTSGLWVLERSSSGLCWESRRHNVASESWSFSGNFLFVICCKIELLFMPIFLRCGCHYFVFNINRLQYLGSVYFQFPFKMVILFVSRPDWVGFSVGPSRDHNSTARSLFFIIGSSLLTRLGPDPP